MNVHALYFTYTHFLVNTLYIDNSMCDKENMLYGIQTGPNVPLTLMVLLYDSDGPKGPNDP